MKFETTFSPRDKAWCVDFNNNKIKELTVGRVEVQLVDSDGIDGETVFSNYMPQSSFKESYMCVESGIGSGQVFTMNESIFKTESEAKIALKEREEL